MRSKKAEGRIPLATCGHDGWGHTVYPDTSRLFDLSGYGRRRLNPTYEAHHFSLLTPHFSLFPSHGSPLAPHACRPPTSGLSNDGHEWPAPTPT